MIEILNEVEQDSIFIAEQTYEQLCCIIGHCSCNCELSRFERVDKYSYLVDASVLYILDKLKVADNENNFRVILEAVEDNLEFHEVFNKIVE